MNQSICQLNRQAALNRQKALEALEASANSSARRRGVWHEARHVAKVGWVGPAGCR